MSGLSRTPDNRTIATKEGEACCGEANLPASGRLSVGRYAAERAGAKSVSVLQLLLSLCHRGEVDERFKSHAWKACLG